MSSSSETPKRSSCRRPKDNKLLLKAIVYYFQARQKRTNLKTRTMGLGKYRVLFGTLLVAVIGRGSCSLAFRVDGRPFRSPPSTFSSPGNRRVVPSFSAFIDANEIQHFFRRRSSSGRRPALSMIGTCREHTNAHLPSTRNASQKLLNTWHTSQLLG